MAVIKIVPMPGAVGDKGDEGAPGPQGQQGPAGQNGLPGTPALWSYQGAYNPAAAYAVGDVVVYQGQLYYTKSVTTAGTLPTVTAKFDLIASKGADGTNGTNGTNGADGAPGAAGADFGIYYLGNYNPNSGYLPNIAVVRGSDGQLYLAKASGQLGDPVGNTAQWEVWIPKGQDGAPGATPFTLIGAYDNGAAYNLGIAVYYNGGTYVRTGNPLNPGYPPTLGAINESWTPIAEKGADGSQLNYWDGIEQPNPHQPAEPGFLVVDGITNNEILDIVSADRIYLSSNNGEFINDPNIPSNQIATIGDIEEIHTLSNGLVVNGYIDDEGINPAGTMSLNVGPGYSALMDLSAHSATFNGDVQITNLSGTRVTTIETPTTINNDLTVTGNVSMPSLITSGSWGHDFFEESGLTTETYDTVADYYKIGELVYFDLNVNLGYVTDWGQTQVDPPLWHSWSFKLPYNARGIYATSNPAFVGTIYDSTVAEEISERTSNDQGHNPIFGKIVNAGGQSYVYLYSIVNSEFAGWAPGELRNISSVFPKDFTQPENIQTGLNASRLRISGTYRSV